MRLLESRWLLPLAEDQPELYEPIIGLVRNPLRLLQLSIAAGIGLHYFALPEAVASIASRLTSSAPYRDRGVVLVKLVNMQGLAPLPRPRDGAYTMSP